MAKVTVLRREEIASKTGLDRYADNVEACLRNTISEYNEISFNISNHRGLGYLFVNGFLRPLFSCLKIRSEDVTVHATDELCGVFFPWTRGKKILTVHHVIGKGEYGGRLYYHVWNSVTKVAIRNSDVVIAASFPTRDAVIDHFGVDENKVVVMTSPLDPQYKVLESIKKEKMIGCVGTLIPRKNIVDSITAFDKFVSMPGMGGYELHICGVGPEKDYLESVVEDLGLWNKVRFISGLSEEEIVQFYNRAALIFNTSLHEGLGLVTPEAQICGTPILHLEYADIPEFVTEASISCSDTDDMAEKAYRLMADPDEYDAVVKSGFEHAKAFGEGFNTSLLKVYGLR
ncbi:MAG: glycosyltransferase [Candidatus Methanoplasma sp.]|jgi:glycosyltransferase involved in cell wall biosynthesis|nr:glycosyltransferase [Candidatus Methanoplasma sp.]